MENFYINFGMIFSLSLKVKNKKNSKFEIRKYQNAKA